MRRLSRNVVIGLVFAGCFLAFFGPFFGALAIQDGGAEEPGQQVTCVRSVSRAELGLRHGQSKIIVWTALVEVPGDGPCADRPVPDIYPGFVATRDSNAELSWEMRSVPSEASQVARVAHRGRE